MCNPADFIFDIMGLANIADVYPLYTTFWNSAITSMRNIKMLLNSKHGLHTAY